MPNKQIIKPSHSKMLNIFCFFILNPSYHFRYCQKHIDFLPDYYMIFCHNDNNNKYLSDIYPQRNHPFCYWQVFLEKLRQIILLNFSQSEHYRKSQYLSEKIELIFISYNFFYLFSMCFGSGSCRKNN